MVEILHSGFDGLTFTLTSNIPDGFADKLASAKAYAKETHTDCILELGTIKLSVTATGARGYTCNTGNHGAVWLIQDPTDPIPNNPMIKVDFRAMGLALHGLEGAERHFRDCMAAFDIPYVETQLRVSRVDFAVDVLAPWFEPDRHALVVPAHTRVSELTGVEETENPTRADKRKGSFRINIQKGCWSDFATGDAGGDPVSLYAYLNGLNQIPAARQLMARIGVAI